LDTIRFQWDKCVSNEIAIELRRRGIDVVTAHQADLRGKTNHVVLAPAHQAFMIAVQTPDVLRMLEGTYQAAVGRSACWIDGFGALLDGWVDDDRLVLEIQVRRAWQRAECG
jgi:hypothetical protein